MGRGEREESKMWGEIEGGRKKGKGIGRQRGRAERKSARERVAQIWFQEGGRRGSVRRGWMVLGW